ncbi:MAG: rod shape-determining protein MreC [Clostridiales bacterium]|nr:rod shape-determining protein MreC [Clostridiales bacterium]
MRSLVKSIGFKIFAVVMAALVFGAVLATATHKYTSPVTSVISFVFSPVQRLSAFFADKLAESEIYFKSSASMAKRVSELESQLADARGQLVEYEDAKNKLSLYEEFLELKKEHSDYKFESCSIISRDAADLFGSFVLNKGEMHGIKVNDPVIYGKYLVGLVVSVSKTQCTVRTILNPDVNVSAYDIRTGESGFVATTPELSRKGLCRLPGLDRTTAISQGGLVCTSGVGGIYPRDLIIGQVTGIENDNENISSYAVIEPSVRFSELKDVFVLTYFYGQEGTAGDGQ